MASEVALARRDSPARGGRHLGFAKALVYQDTTYLGGVGVRCAVGVARDVDCWRVGLPGGR